MQNLHLFDTDFQPIFLVGAVLALVGVCCILRRALPRQPRGW